MGTNSLTNDENSIFLLDDDNISLYYGLVSNKSETEDEEQSIDNIKNVSSLHYKVKQGMQEWEIKLKET